MKKIKQDGENLIKSKDESLPENVCLIGEYEDDKMPIDCHGTNDFVFQAAKMILEMLVQCYGPYSNLEEATKICEQVSTIAVDNSWKDRKESIMH